MPIALQRVFGAIAGGLLGTLVLIILFYAIQFSMELFDVNRARFRIPVFLVVLPFIGMWFGFKAAPGVLADQSALLSGAQNSLANSWITRLALVGPALWVLAVFGFVMLFEPYGYSMNDRDYFHLAKVVVFPVTLFWLCILGARFVINGPQRKE